MNVCRGYSGMWGDLDPEMSTSSAFWALFLQFTWLLYKQKHCFWAYKTCCCSLHAHHWQQKVANTSLLES